MLKSIDIFSIPISLNYNNLQTYSTKLGGLVSSSIIFLILLFIIYFSSEILMGIDPNVSIRNTYFKNHPIRSISNENFFFAFRIEDGFGSSIKIREDYLNIRATYIRIANSKKNSTLYDIVSCKDLWDNDHKFGRLFYNYDLSTLYCVNFTDSKIYGYYNIDDYRYINIEFEICDNYTNFKCASKESIYKEYQLKTIHFFLYNNEINTNSIDNPIINNIYNVYNLFDFQIYKQMEVYYKNITITSDEGLIMPLINNKTDIIFDSTDKLFGLVHENNKDGIFYNFNIFLRRNYLVYNRVYKRVHEVFASLGGIIQFLKIIGKLFISSLSLKAFELDLCNNFYKFNLDNEIILAKKPSKYENSFTNKSKRKDDSVKTKLVMDESMLKSTDFDSKVLKYIDIMNTNTIKKRLLYNNCEIFKSVLCFKKFHSSNLILKEKFYKYSIHQINSYLDISNIIKMSKELFILKDILFTNEQKLAISYINHNELNKKNLFKKESNQEDILKVVMNYILKNKSVNSFKKTDNNILKSIDIDLKNLIF